MENLHVWANSVQNIKIPEKEKIIQKCRRGLFKFGPKVSKILKFLNKKMPKKAFFKVLRITGKCLGEQDSDGAIGGGGDGRGRGRRTRRGEWGRSPCRA